MAHPVSKVFGKKIPPPPLPPVYNQGDKGNINKGVGRKGEGEYSNPENNAFPLFTCLVNILKCYFSI